MSVFSTCLPILAESDVSVETYDRAGSRVHSLDGQRFNDLIVFYRQQLRDGPVVGRKVIGLLFRSEESIELLVISLAGMAEGYTVVPFYPNWSAETQLFYVERYGIRTLAVADGFAGRAEEWLYAFDRVLHVRLDVELGDGVKSAPPSAVFPDNLPQDHPCAWIFTSGTSGNLAKCTEISLANLEAAVENIRSLDFLQEGMVVHSPLSASHIFAFVVIMGFLTLKPRRVIFSDVQYLARLPEDRIGKIDAMILVPIVLDRLRASFYEKLTSQTEGSKTHLPLAVRKALKHVTRLAEDTVIRLEEGRRWAGIGLPALYLARTLFGKRLRRFLGSPKFVVIGGAKPNLNSMALLEVMGVRCLQGWGMTETTGPLAVCDPRDRFSGAFGTCGGLFPRTAGSIEEGELVVEGPQIARGYVEPDGTVVPFNGRKKTGDTAIFDVRGRLKVLGKASDRITTSNGLNYNPLPLEEEIKALDLNSRNLFDEVVVIGDGKPRLGAVFFLREISGAEDAEVRAYVKRLLADFGASRRIDEKIGPWAISESSLPDVGGLGPSGKLVRRRIEEQFCSIYGEVLA